MVSPPPPVDCGGHAGAAARLRSKQSLLDILVERVRDQSAFTRKQVMATWMDLAAVDAGPLGHWVCVTKLAIGEHASVSFLVCLDSCHSPSATRGAG